MTPRIVVVGSANTDFVLQVPELPGAGATVLGRDFQVVRGGKGANQAVAAARLGADVTLVARLGNDRFGDEALAAFREEGIRADHVARDPQAHSGIALIMVSASGENIIGVGPGANGRLTPEDVSAASTAIAQADCLLLQLEIPLETVQAAVEIAHRHGVRVILNPAPARKVPADLLEKVSYLTPNETEASVLAGDDVAGSVVDSLPGLASKLRVPNLVVTLGLRGAGILQNSEATVIPSFPVKPVDTTAAGDAFNGALAVALARGEELSQAVRYANAAGAITATRPGAQPSLPTREELERFIRSTKT